MNTVRLIWSICILFLLSSCHLRHRGGQEEACCDLPQIVDKGELVVLTVNNSTSYFDYRGEPMGFQYELAQQFARSLGVELRVKVMHNSAEMVSALCRGEGDLIAYNLNMTNQWKDSLIYCGKENITHQVLVQRRARKSVKDVTQLIGKEVYVQPGKYLTRLENLDKELGGGIVIRQVKGDTLTIDELITMVAEGKIDYTVASNEVARINRTYHSNLDIHLEISFDQRSSWAVRKTSPQLAQAADKWHKENINSPEFKACAKRYFELNKLPLHGTILSLKDGKISIYDALFRKYAEVIGWDWRMLASLAYIESNFDTHVVSWAGAKGLMQLMPATARAMGVPAGKEADPEESIKAGVKYIAYLQRLFSKVPDKEERLKFVLAAYNAGAGHVTDAMALAEKYGRSRYVWSHQVEHYLLLKNHEEYYQDPVCKNGYFRGTETYNFVRDVMECAAMYRSKVKK